MWTQARDETVEHAEKVASERVFHRRHDVWDVHTDQGRWWVVSDPMNLYSQNDFKSMDGVLSFHIGLSTRMYAAQARTAPDTPEPRFLRMRRQWEQAAEAQNDANEAEEFQAVGLRCRETLVTMVQDIASADLVPEGEEAPKASDFIHWSELIANAVAPGPSRSHQRSYLKSLARETWEYVSWLTHAKNATRADGDFCVEAVANFLTTFEGAIFRKELGGPERCPSCASYRLDSDGYFDEEEDVWLDLRICAACGWTETFEPEPLHSPPAEPTEVTEVTGDCLPSSDL